jgi:exonuclease VII small subunit
VAQPLPKPEETSSGIDDAVSRLEQAFLRLEAAVETSRKGNHSLKADNEKLNHLLHDADEEIGRLREAVYTVTERLDRTIGMLEMENG